MVVELAHITTTETKKCDLIKKYIALDCRNFQMSNICINYTLHIWVRDYFDI
jgi:hypothetical protein